MKTPTTLGKWKKEHQYYHMDAQTKRDIADIVHLPTSRKGWAHTYVPLPRTMVAEEDDRYEKEHLQYVLKRRMERCLNKREQYVLRHFYGIGDVTEMGMEEISERLDLTRDRVRQIKITALKKLNQTNNEKNT